MHTASESETQRTNHRFFRSGESCRPYQKWRRGSTSCRSVVVRYVCQQGIELASMIRDKWLLQIGCMIIGWTSTKKCIVIKTLRSKIPRSYWNVQYNHGSKSIYSDSSWSLKQLVNIKKCVLLGEVSKFSGLNTPRSHWYHRFCRIKTLCSRTSAILN